jgi:UDP-glucuronate 4-epimerase
LLPKSSIQIEEIDISNKLSIRSLINKHKPETVIHLAAQPGVRLPYNDYDIYLRENVLAFNNLISVSVEQDISTFIYASSSSVYDDSSGSAFEENSTNLNPKSFYGMTKKWNEEIAQHFSNQFGIRTRGLRFFTVYGPWGRPDMAYFRLMASALGQHEFTLFGDGSVKRDFTYIEDVCFRIHRAAIELKCRPSGFSDVVNIGGQSPHSMVDLIEKIEKITSTRLQYKIGKKNVLDLQVTEADKSYGSSIFGDVPYKSLEEGVKEFYKWASNPKIAPKLKSWIASTK